MAAFTTDWDTDQSSDSTDAILIDDYINKTRTDIEERLKNWIYGFVAGENDGVGGLIHAPFKVQTSDPTVAASTISLYSKDVSSEAHLYFKDESADVRQVTKAAGLLNIIAGDYAADSIDEDDIQLANNAALTAKDAAGTGTVNLILAGTNDLPTLPDSAEMASNAAPVEDEAIANKKYVNDEDTADHPAYTGGESHTDGSGLIMKMGEESVAGNATDEITYGAAFPTGVISSVCSYKSTSAAITECAVCTPKSGSETSILQVTNGMNTTLTISWIAIGH